MSDFMPKQLYVEEGFIPFPLPNNPNTKVEITRADGTIDNITANLLFCEFNLPLIQLEIGNFKIKLDNNSEQYNDLYHGNETVNIYLDHSAGTSLKFTGKIEKVKRVLGDAGNTLEIGGVHVAKDTLDKNITLSSTNTSSSILTTIAAELSGFGTANITSTTTNRTVNWSEKPFKLCFSDLCDLEGYDGYIDNSKGIHFFPAESITAELAYAHSEMNLLSNEGFGEDITEMKNVVTVYGKTVKGIKIVYKAEDTTVSGTYGVKEYVINDSNVTTNSEAKARADAELEILKGVKTIGKVTVWGLENINPGDLVWLSLLPVKVQNKFKIVNIIHVWDLGEWRTTLELQDLSRRGISDYFKERRVKELGLQKLDNPNKVRQTINFDFDSDNGTHSGTEVRDGRLYLKSGFSNGTWTYTTTIAFTATQAELDIISNDFESSNVKIRFNSPDSFTILSKGNLISVNGGINVEIQVNIVSDSNNLVPYVDSLGIGLK